MPGGRPRKPIDQKIAEGTFRADRDGPIDALVTAEGTPVAPEHLADDAKAFWGDIVPGLIKRGVVSSCDAPGLVMLCEWYALYRQYHKALQETDPSAIRSIYQLTVLCGIATTNFDRLASKFGLTPSDRAKLRLSPTTTTRRVPSRKR